MADGLADLSNPKNALVPSGLADVLPELPQSEVPVCNFLTANGTFVQCSEKGERTSPFRPGTLEPDC